ncbi:MAG: DNA-processing protein DprA [Lachnospiraceae bacterium]|nr:DNA-processing protein DprA [Lachnospiraceae bacterium]
MDELSKERDLLHIWLDGYEIIGNVSKRKLIEELGDVEKVYEASLKILSSIISEEKARLLVKDKSLECANEKWEYMINNNIDIVYPEHKNYPEKLKNIHDMPDILYIRGKLKPVLNMRNRNIGIVGSRNADTYGREIAFSFGKKLSKNGINIISGMALGIDGMAHRGALSADGYTVAVLGGGIDVIYPKENYDIYSELINKGAIISEYGPGVIPLPRQFPIRNRIISGLSDGVLVVEAKKKSGSLITADLAVEQGKNIYAIPGRIGDRESDGTNNLIKQGAMCVTSPQDITDDLNMFSDVSLNNSNDQCDDADLGIIKDNISDTEKAVLEILSLEPVYIESIIEKINLGVSEVLNKLYAMEDKGLIKQVIKGYYIINISEKS